MRLDELLTDDAVLAELGSRLARHRLERNLTQADLAQRAGVGTATLQRVEHGQSVQMTTMVRVLRALDLLGGLDAAIPESLQLPLAQLQRDSRRPRRRAAGRRGRPAPRGTQPWQWGDAGEDR
jgi:transcriptional regulator with XRE-family HTH domain